MLHKNKIIWRLIHINKLLSQMLDYRDKDFIFTKEDCNYFKRKIATILKEDFVFSDEERKEINSQYSDLIKK